MVKIETINMAKQETKLRMNQGDPNQARVYYLPHFVAADLGLFQRESLDVEFVWVPGLGQVPAVEQGLADLTIGGPMVTMQMRAEGKTHFHNFCAAVQANPWYLVSKEPQTGFTFRDLVGKTVIDMANIPTSTLALRWVLVQNGIRPESVNIEKGCGNEKQDIERLLSGEVDYLHHNLHTLGPKITIGEMWAVQDMANPTGNVPWSAYIAPPQTIAANPAGFQAFTNALARALRWIEAHSGREIAELVKSHYPHHSLEDLIEAVSRYKANGIWPRSTVIPESQYEHFRDILMATGWFSTPVPYEDQVEVTMATRADAASGSDNYVWSE
jgi:NitT/TauT family transport system substrate-binding protein